MRAALIGIRSTRSRMSRTRQVPRSGISSPKVSFRIILTPRPRHSFLTRQHAASSLTCWRSSHRRNDWCKMLTDEALIDACVAGTEHAHLIDRAAKAQRAGVLATLSEVGASLKLLPTLEQCDGRRFTFREWAQRRRHCIFITSTQSTREALRRTHAAWFNILFGKLMGTSLTTSGQRPCWVMIDEALAEAITGAGNGPGRSSQVPRQDRPW